MFPDLIDLGFLHLKTYGACMATGFLLCWWLVERLSGRKDLSNLLLALMVVGVVGSRIAYVIEHWSLEFAAHPERIVRVDQGGLMFYGGLILALVVFFAWCRRTKEHPLALANLLATVVPLGHAFGRLGCFFYGCCYGRDSDAWCAVTFPVGSPSWYEHERQLVSVLPTQLLRRRRSSRSSRFSTSFTGVAVATRRAPISSAMRSSASAWSFCAAIRARRSARSPFPRRSRSGWRPLVRCCWPSMRK